MGLPTEEVEELLADERRRIQALLDDTGSDDPEAQSEETGELSSADQHAADSGTETQMREQQLSMRSMLVAELTAVDEAGARLAAGTYGVCAVCGKLIAPDRLRALPTTPFCVDDARAATA